MGMSGGNKKGPISDINITPLVDVVLVLLIIFIVIAPQLQKGIDVEMPLVAKHAKKEDDKKEKPKELIITMKQNGDVYIDKQQVVRTDFVSAIKRERAKAENATKTLVLKVDARATYGQVRGLMKDCQEAGIQGIGLAVKEDTKLGEHN